MLSSSHLPTLEDVLRELTRLGVKVDLTWAREDVLRSPICESYLEILLNPTLLSLLLTSNSYVKVDGANLSIEHVDESLPLSVKVELFPFSHYSLPHIYLGFGRAKRQDVLPIVAFAALAESLYYPVEHVWDGFQVSCLGRELASPILPCIYLGLHPTENVVRELKELLENLDKLKIPEKYVSALRVLESLNNLLTTKSFTVHQGLHLYEKSESWVESKIVNLLKEILGLNKLKNLYHVSTFRGPEEHFYVSTSPDKHIIGIVIVKRPDERVWAYRVELPEWLNLEEATLPVLFRAVFEGKLLRLV